MRVVVLFFRTVTGYRTWEPAWCEDGDPDIPLVSVISFLTFFALAIGIQCKILLGKIDSAAFLLTFDNSDLGFLQYWQFLLNTTK